MTGTRAVVHDRYPDAYIRDILRNTRVIAMVGASPNWNRPSYFAMKYLQEKGYRVIPVNPVAAGQTILGEPVYATLDELPLPSLSTTHCARQQRFHSKIRNWTELLTHGVENDRI